MPPNWKQANDYSAGFYSPGICPKDYTEGCQFPTTMAQYGPNSGWISYGGPVLASETVRICCPNGYKCVTEGVQKAYSMCVGNDDPTERAYAIQVRWQASDLSILATDPTVPGKTWQPDATAGSGSVPFTASATATDAGAAATGAGAAATSTSTSVPSPSHLNKAMTVGIGIGAGAAAFILGFIAFFMWSRRRKQRGARLNSMVGHDGDKKTEVMELDSKSMATAELDSSSPLTPTELDTKASVGSELDSRSVIAEMPAKTQFYAELPGDMPQLYHEKHAQGGCAGRDAAEGVSPQSEESCVLPGHYRRASKQHVSPTSATEPTSGTSMLSPRPISWGSSSVSGSVSDMSARGHDGNTF